MSPFSLLFFSVSFSLSPLLCYLLADITIDIKCLNLFFFLTFLFQKRGWLSDFLPRKIQLLARNSEFAWGSIDGWKCGQSSDNEIFSACIDAFHMVIGMEVRSCAARAFTNDINWSWKEQIKTSSSASLVLYTILSKIIRFGVTAGIWSYTLSFISFLEFTSSG